MNVKTMSAREHGVGDSRLMGPVSGLLWITAGIAAAVVQPLPGTPQGHAVLAWSLIALIMVYGVACVRGWIDWERRTLRDHAVAIIVFQPLIALGLWVSGGVDSYLGPILVLPTLYVAYFFPPRFAWPLAVIEIATYCSPFLYSDTDHDHLLLGRAVMYAAAYAGLVATIQYLKSHLVAAERKQRRMAHEDPLTGLPNWRAFDGALDAAVAGGRPFSLLLVDVDHFKTINDTFGHTTGDEILCGIAARTRACVRATDTLARIGGDELALVAPDASSAGAERLASALHGAVEGLLPAEGAAPVTLTISWASFPEDGRDRDELLRAADRRLHAVKDDRSVAAGSPAFAPGPGAVSVALGAA
jgi:diguanylate cyclase (GGDEF)-like protein